MNTMHTLTGIFRMVFDDHSIHIERNTTADDIEGWDSLSHQEIINAVQSHFNITFTEKELLTLTNVGDLLDHIESKMA